MVMLRGDALAAVAAPIVGRMLNVGADGFEIEETPGTYVSPINGNYEDELFAAAGRSSPAGALLLTIFIGSWILNPISRLQTTRFFSFFGVRSDLIFSIIIGFVLPLFVMASGVLVGRDAFVWMKVSSLTLAAVTFTSIKYVFPPANRIVSIFGKELRMSFVYSQLGHGILVLNMAEAVFWELTQLEGAPYNYINGISGGIQTLCVLAFARRYGFSVAESDEERTRQLRANLSPMFIFAYTLWNVEYNAVYHSEKASYYIITTLLVPLAASLVGFGEWLEIRAQSLLHAILLRVMPLNISASVNATLFLGIGTFESQTWRYTLSVLSALSTLVLLVEVFFYINTGKKHWNLPYGLTFAIDVDERHPEVYYRDGDKDDGAGHAKVMASDI